MKPTTPKERLAMRRIMTAVVETVRQCEPAPESLIHLALQGSLHMSHEGCSMLIDALIDVGHLRRDEHHRLITTADAVKETA